MHVLLDRFVFATRRRPDLIQIRAAQSLFFDQESKEFLQLLDVLWLMQTIAKDDVQHFIVFDPFLEGEHRAVVRRVESYHAVLRRQAFRLVRTTEGNAIGRREARDELVHFVERVHFPVEGIGLQQPKDHLQSKGVEILTGLGILRHAGGEIAKPFDDRGQRITFVFTLGFKLEIGLGQLIEKLWNEFLERERTPSS